MKKINCNFDIEQIQFMYYLLEKEAKSTERFLFENVKDKKSTLASYEDLLNKKNMVESLKKKIQKSYGGVHAK